MVAGVPNSCSQRLCWVTVDMSDRSGIQWTEATWNPTTGCDRVSPGCDRCYAMALAKRLKAMGSARYQRDGDPQTSGPGFGLTMHHEALDLPTRWAGPRVVFVNSMSDLFHPGVPVGFIREVFDVMVATGQGGPSRHRASRRNSPRRAVLLRSRPGHDLFGHRRQVEVDSESICV